MSDSNNMNDEIAAAEAALKEAQERLRVAREKQAQGGQPEGSSEIGGADQPGGADQSNQQGHDAWSQAYQQGHGAWSQSSQQASDVWGQTYWQASGQAYQQSQGPWQANQAYSQSYGQPYQQPFAQADVGAVHEQHVVHVDKVSGQSGALPGAGQLMGQEDAQHLVPGSGGGSIFSLGIAGLAMVVISIVEGVLYLSKSQTEFEQVYVFNKKEWF